MAGGIRSLRSARFLFGLVGLGILYTYYSFPQADRRTNGSPSCKYQIDPFVRPKLEPDRRPRVWISGNDIYAGYLTHVFAVFSRLGYVNTTDGSSDWDVMWAHGYPFRKLASLLADLQPHQRINKFPGNGAIVIKTNLISPHIPEFPTAFRIPQDKDAFLKHAHANSDILWVQKNNKHRGISIKSISELNLTSGQTFVQQFVGDPLLIDGRRFDIGIYTTLTSVNPLRVYISEGDWVIRFCPKDYHPFDPDDNGRYVVGKGFTPLQEIPSLSKLYSEEGYTYKEALLAQLRRQGYDTKLLDRKLRNVIRKVYLAKESHFIKQTAKYPTSRHFFEMVRFDFLIDAAMNVYLMEVNMSPNMFLLQDRRIYEQTIYSMLGLVGVARTNGGTHPTRSTYAEREMQVSDRDIAIPSGKCVEQSCQQNCHHVDCQLCSSCLRTADKKDLRMAFLEHVNRRQWRRVVPVTFQTQEEARDLKKDPSFASLNKKNKWMARWFREKCLRDITWCH